MKTTSNCSQHPHALLHVRKTNAQACFRNFKRLSFSLRWQYYPLPLHRCVAAVLCRLFKHPSSHSGCADPRTLIFSSFHPFLSSATLTEFRELFVTFFPIVSWRRYHCAVFFCISRRGTVVYFEKRIFRVLLSFLSFF